MRYCNLGTDGEALANISVISRTMK